MSSGTRTIYAISKVNARTGNFYSQLKVLKFRTGIRILHKPVPETCCAHDTDFSMQCWEQVIFLHNAKFQVQRTPVLNCEQGIVILGFAAAIHLAENIKYSGLFFSYTFGRKHQIFWAFLQLYICQKTSNITLSSHQTSPK